MKVNQFNITENMARVKADLPEWTWDDIIKCGLAFARIISEKDNSRKYKKLYWLSKKSIKELSTYKN